MIHTLIDTLSTLPFWGRPPGDTTEPDPYIWWIAAPVGAYLLALVTARVVTL